MMDEVERVAQAIHTGVGFFGTWEEAGASREPCLKAARDAIEAYKEAMEEKDFGFFPREPTVEMLKAVARYSCINRELAKRDWQTMIATWEDDA
jgi:hypothetical protein|tara:strand:+ start:640 stop:921 length:282 start_codon:yes stop_codon:yes gene_type:complete